MTTQRTDNRFGAFGKTVGGVLATATGLIGAWGWVYLLIVSVQGTGGISDIGMPFFIIGLVLWIVFWGGALAITAGFFGRKSRVVRVAFGITGVMLVAAIITPTVAAAT